MKYRFFYLFFLIHAGLGFSGLLLLEGGALAAADSGAGAGYPLLLLAGVVRFLLLQPLAHWLLPIGGAGIGTWAGLAQVAAIVAANSLLVAGLVSFARSRLRTDMKGS